jgi:hypothetical protein
VTEAPIRYRCAKCGNAWRARHHCPAGVTACPAPQPRSHIEGVNLPPVNPRPAPPPVPGASTSCPLCHAVGGGHFSGCSQYRPSMTMGCEACESLGCTGACGVREVGRG